MNSIPLVNLDQESEIIAWRKTRPITRAALVADACRLAQRLPDRTHVANYCIDRYHFLAALLAAIMRNQITCLPNDRTPSTLSSIAHSYPGLYGLADSPITDGIVDIIPVEVDGVFSRPPPCVAGVATSRTVVQVFTSGTTGRPVAHEKTWGALVGTARLIANRVDLDVGRTVAIVATVPPQHMYGLETSIMLPLVAGASTYCSRPLYPADIRSALDAVPEPRILVTTPIHLRALVRDCDVLPRLAMIISATAALSPDLAAHAEARFETRVIEIFGCTEAGSLATRRTVNNDNWFIFDGLTLTLEKDIGILKAPYLRELVRMNDLIELKSPREFILHGRQADLVIVAGKRTSLAGLNSILSSCDGVVDGAFYVPPDDKTGKATRLTAIVVAPGVPVSDIMNQLRQRLDPAFVPRRVLQVSRLPRNDVGKLTMEALMELMQEPTG